MIKIFIISGVIVLVLSFYSLIPTIYYKNHYMNKHRKSGEGKRIALTFDDGPSSQYTPALLDLLKKYNVKATFFMVASFAERNWEVVERIVEEGHEIGIHSFEHKNALIKGPWYTKRDFNNAIGIFNRYGWNIKYYRPPWGHINLFTLKMVKKYNLHMVFWTVMAQDWSGSIKCEEITRRLNERITEGSVICLHDGRGKNQAPSRTIKALEQVIPRLLKEGYEFVTIGELNEKQ